MMTRLQTMGWASLLAIGVVGAQAFTARFGAMPLAHAAASLTQSAPSETGDWRYNALQRFPAAEAHQGVAVDADHFYAITNRAIGKYRKANGERTAGWDAPKESALKHLNAGVVLEGKLHVAHSNFPTIPEESSVEIWDAATLQHVGRHVFENPPGSLTWVDRKNGSWFACFAHYRQTSDPARTVVVKFNDRWQEQARFRFPPNLVERFAGASSSGGAFGPGGHLFVTGHDAQELYVLDIPTNDDTLIWTATIPIRAAGQAFAWDRTDDGVLYSIQRKTRDVLVSRITRQHRPEGR